MKRRIVLEAILLGATILLLAVCMYNYYSQPSSSETDTKDVEVLTYDDPNMLGLAITEDGQRIIDAVDLTQYGRYQYSEGVVEPIIEVFRSRTPKEIDLSAVVTECTLSEKHYDTGDAYVLTPEDRGNSDLTILYIHGGAYLLDLPESEISKYDKLAQDSHAQVYVPDYQPIFLGTYEEAYELILEVYRDIRPQTKNLAIVGTSAGGGLALGFVEYLNEIGEPIPEKMLLLCPWIDATMSNPDIEKYEERDRLLGPHGLRLLGALWAGDTDPSDYRISPINGDFSKPMPETLIMIGTEEIMYPDNMLLYKKLLDNGHDVRILIGEGLFHVFMFNSIPEGEKAMEISVQFLLGEELG